MTVDNEVEDFLEHFGVKGMRWGVRQNNKLQRQASATDKRTKQGKKVNSLAKESQRVQDAGGGLRGTQRVRKQMVKEGTLSKADARKGSARFARNLAIASIGASAVTMILTSKRGRARITDLKPLSKTNSLSSLPFYNPSLNIFKSLPSAWN